MEHLWDRMKLMRQEKNLGWEYPPFEIPEHIYKAWDARKKGQGTGKQMEHRARKI